MPDTAHSDDAPHQHYSLRHRLISFASRNVFGNVTYTVRHGLLAGMKRKGGLGFLPSGLIGSSETQETVFWRSLDLRDKIVYDVGAFEGLLTLFFARQARQVISYEPNSRNYQRLVENVRLNDLRNVTVRKRGVGAEERKTTLVWNPAMPGGASAEPMIAGEIRNAAQPMRSEEIVITTLDQDIAETSLPAPDLLKIDIEGLELEALQGARHTLEQHAPALFLEMHGETMAEKRRKVAELVSFLTAAGYAAIVHVESRTPITQANSAHAAEGHLYCSKA